MRKFGTQWKIIGCRAPTTIDGMNKFCTKGKISFCRVPTMSDRNK